jgi:hypothetical protein
VTFVRRPVFEHPELSHAVELLKAGSFEAAIEFLSMQLRQGVDWTNASEPVFVSGSRRVYSLTEVLACLYYLRAMARLSLAIRSGGTQELYGHALNDFRESFTLDWKPLADHSNIFPEHEWAFPAYVELLKDCLLQVRKFISDFNPPATIWAVQKPGRLACEVAKAIANVGGTSDALVDVLLEFAHIEPSFDLCEFRRALTSLGWKPSLHGFAQVTEDDLRNPNRRRDTLERRRVERRWYDYFYGLNLSEAETEEVNHHQWQLEKLAVPELRQELTSNDRLRRAVARILLILAEDTPAIDECALDLRNSHRFVRLSAIHCVVEHLAASGAPIGDDEFVRGLDHLLQVIAADKAGICRHAGLIGLAKVARRVHALQSVDLVSRCRSLVDAALADKQREVVHGGVIAARHFGPFSQDRLKFVLQIPVEYKNRFGEFVHDWQMVCDKAESIIALTPVGDPLRMNVWKEFRPLLGRGFQPTRFAAVKTVNRLRIVETEIIEELRPLLVRRTNIDDSEEVRALAKAALDRTN